MKFWNSSPLQPRLIYSILIHVTKQLKRCSVLYHFSCFHSHHEFSDLNGIRKMTDSYLSCRSSHRGRGSKLQGRHKAPLASIRYTCGPCRDVVGTTDKDRGVARALLVSGEDRQNWDLRRSSGGKSSCTMRDSWWWGAGSRWFGVAAFGLRTLRGEVLLCAGCGETQAYTGKEVFISVICFRLFLKFPWL
jgi:hypothetical protein